MDFETRHGTGDPDCETCNDTGYICGNCQEGDGDCTCDDGPELERCPDCSVLLLLRGDTDADEE